MHDKAKRGDARISGKCSGVAGRNNRWDLQAPKKTFGKVAGFRVLSPEMRVLFESDRKIYEKNIFWIFLPFHLRYRSRSQDSGLYFHAAWCESTLQIFRHNWTEIGELPTVRLYFFVFRSFSFSQWFANMFFFLCFYTSYDFYVHSRFVSNHNFNFQCQYIFRITSRLCSFLWYSCEIETQMIITAMKL